MADTIREALERLLAVIKPKYTDPDEIVAVVRAMAAARAALAAEPPAPAPAADGERDHVPGAGNMVPAAYAARLRQCPTHGQLPANAWGCPECLRELREELARLRGSTPPADGEAEALAQWLDWLLPAFHREHDSTHASNCLRAAALLREARPQPVPAAERPWKRPGWRDAEGRCWWFNRFGIPEWQLADGGPYGDFCLPHWAIPQPPQGGEVEQ